VAEQLATFQQVYTPGSDISAASETAQLVWGRTGNDFMLGFQRVNPGLSPTQVDYFLGDVAVDDQRNRQWRDTFALGDWQRPYYANSNLVPYGLNEYAIVTDFNPALDRVQLFGNANNYRLLQIETGTLLLLQKPPLPPFTGGQSAFELDVVGFFLGSTNLQLTAPYFKYQGNVSTARVRPEVRQVGTPGFDLLIATTTDAQGNVYQAGATTGAIVGTASNNESRDAAIIKYAANGSELWRRQFGSSRWDTIFDLKTDAQGNLYAAGVTYGNLAATKSGDVSDVFLAKYDSNGNQLWIRQFGEAGTNFINSTFSLDVDASGTAYLSGLTARPTQTNPLPIDNFWVTRYDTNGNRQWFTEFGTPDFDEPYATAVSVDGSIYSAGWTFGSFGGPNQGVYDGAIAKLNPQGQVLWRRNFGTNDYEWIWGADTDSQGNLYISGWTLGSLAGNTNAGNADAFLAKYDANGTVQWIRQFGTAGDDQGFRMAIDANDNIFVTGYSDGALGGASAGDYDSWVARYDTSGNRQWIRQFGTNDVDQANGISVDNLGNVYVTGVTQGSLGATNAGSFDSWIARLSGATGNLLSFGSPAAATTRQSTFPVGNRGTNATVTDPTAIAILRNFFGAFLTQLNLPTGSGGPTGRNATSLFRTTPAVPRRAPIPPVSPTPPPPPIPPTPPTATAATPVTAAAPTAARLNSSPLQIAALTTLKPTNAELSAAPTPPAFRVRDWTAPL
jgi:hypothetical protein